MQNISIKYLQEYIKSKNIDLNKSEAFLKLSEEVGELAKVMLNNPNVATETSLKGTVEEEIYDIICACLIVANCYDIDVEKWIPIKEKINNEKYNNSVVFNPH